MKANEDEIFTIAGKRVRVKHTKVFWCDKCCLDDVISCYPKGHCEEYNKDGSHAYFVSAEKDDKEFCKDSCKGYQETGRCFADGDCKAKQEAESKTSIVPEADLEAEIKRFFDECIVVHHIKMYGSAETVIYADSYELIARHFAEWERKRILDKVVEWMKKNLTYIHPRKGVETCMVNIPVFLDAMNEQNT